MAPPRTWVKVPCVVCSREFSARRTTAKYCDECKPVVNALSMREHTSTCHGCDRRFYRPNADKPFCTACRGEGIGETPPTMEAACTVCGLSEQIALGPKLEICAACIESVEPDDPDHARKMTKWLLAQKRRLASHAVQPTESQKAKPAESQQLTAEQESRHEATARIVLKKEASRDGISVDAYAVSVGFDTVEEYVRAYLDWQKLPDVDQRRGFTHWLLSTHETNEVST
jgi:hypothetical protein